jgi:hypothetical protein
MTVTTDILGSVEKLAWDVINAGYLREEELR